MQSNMKQAVSDLKSKLGWVVMAMGPVSAVVPGGESIRERVDDIIAELEDYGYQTQAAMQTQRVSGHMHGNLANVMLSLRGIPWKH